ncbi:MULTISPECIES: hypothetical protein [Staphylococcus]|uniref:Uncharacterized protein n=1 Tax=Staphylococcus hsinchuensis TaxID=3051183 RepID=A0ABZ3EDQ1_9STAP|nr:MULTISPECIES: hypothetical protein [unclassified Staphylococcus]
MYKFLYVALICGLLAGAGIFLKMPQYPTLAIPMIIAVIGIIATVVTIPNKEISGMLKFGGILINLMPLLGAFTVAH